MKPPLNCVVLALKKDDGKYVALDLGSIRKILDIAQSSESSTWKITWLSLLAWKEGREGPQPLLSPG